MDIRDYALDQHGNDWTALLSGWSDVLPARFTFRFANRFGDVFLVFDDDSVNMLQIDSGELRRLADNCDQFPELLDIGGNANNWLMIPLVDRCIGAGITLTAGQCYGFKIPPIFGGTFTVDNMVAKNISEYYAFLADVLRQTKNIASGASVRLAVKDSR